MGEVASAFVSLRPDGRGFGKGIDGQIGRDLDRAGRTGGKRLGGGLSSSFLPATKAMVGAAAGIFAAAKIGGFLKDSIAEARESQKVGALTTSIIKSTGGAAKVTASQVGDLATAISNKTGMDDEAIQAGSNLLLTFKNVRNEAGKGNKVFDQATQAAVDLSAAGFGSVAGSSKMLGKALNDPIKGISALGRAGVTFTVGQKKQIKGMVEAGDVLGAQKIILGEVQSQVGGAAAASATAGEKLSVAFGNFKEQIGTALLPVIDKVAGFLTTKIIPALSGFISGMQDGTGAGGAFVGFFKSIWAVAKPLGEALLNVVVPAVKGMFASFQAGGGPAKIMAIFTGIRSAIQAAIPIVVQFVTGTLVPLFQQAVAFITTKVVPAVMGIVSAIRGFVVVALPIVQAFVAGMMARIGPMLPQIKAIFAQVGAIVVQVMGLIQAVITRVTAIIGGIWSRWGTNIMDFVAKVFGAILTIIGGALKVISGIIKLFTSILKGDWSGAWAAVKQIVSGAWQAIKGIVSLALTALGGIIKGGGTLLYKAMVVVGDKIRNAILGFSDKLRDAGRALIQGLINGIGDKIQALKNKVGEVAGAIKDFFPGSPVKEGPLRSWNNGGAGKRLGGMLADGLDASRAKVAAASSGLAGSVLAPTGYSGGGESASGAGGGLTQVNLVVDGDRWAEIVFDRAGNVISGGRTMVGQT